MKRIPDFYIWVTTIWLVDLLASVFTSSGYLYRAASPFPLKLLLFALHYSSWFTVALFAVFITYLVKPYIAPIPVLRRIARIVVILLAWFATFVFVISWIVYKRTASFVDFEGFHFFRVNPTQIFLHVLQVEEAGLIQAALAACVLFVGVIVSVKWLRSFLKREARYAILSIGMLFLVLGVSAPFLTRVADAANPVSILDPVENVRFSRTELLEYLQTYHIGPAARLVFGLLKGGINAYSESEFIPTPYPEEKRIISLEEYISKIDRNAIRRYNVVQIIVESLRADRLKKGGAKREVMPNLDAFAEKSIFFENAYAESTHSDYADLCILNSQYPLRSRGHFYYTDNHYPRVLVYDVLHSVGYRTALYSSQNENWGGMMNYLKTDGLNDIFHAGNFDKGTYFSEVDTGLSAKIQMGELTAGKIEDSVTVKEAMEWISENKENPFFISVNLQNSHFPYLVPEEAEAPFKPFALDFPVSFVHYPKEKTPIVENRYDNSLHYMDEQIQKIIRMLEESKLLENTIVVITGDSGEAFHEHGRVTHATELWNEVLKVPLLIYTPGVVPNSLGAPVEHIDIPPTILSLLGLPNHPGFQGKNMLEQKDADQSPLYFVVQTGLADQVAILSGWYKLVLDWRLNRYRLYDLEHDPLELVNLVDRKRETFLELREKLGRWSTEQIHYYENREIYSRFYPRSYK